MKAGERYHTLDGMRGVAALLVAAYHVQQRWHDGSMAGYLAVDLFFGLSGFVIALNYTDRFVASLTVGRFFELRLIRLYPLYLLGLLLGIAKICAGHFLHIPIAATVGSPVCAAAFAAVMLPDPCSSEMFPLNGPSWSLFFELAINVAFAILLWRCSLRLLVALCVISALSFPFFIGHPDFFNLGWAWHGIPGGIARTVFSFCAGVLLYRKFPVSLRTANYAALVPIITMALIIGFAAPEADRAAIEIFSVVVVFPALIFMGCMFEFPSAVLRRILSLFGDLSYPIYAIHWPLIAIMLPIANKLHLTGYLTTIAFLAFLLPAAYVAAKSDERVRAYVSGALKLRRSAKMQVV